MTLLHATYKFIFKKSLSSANEMRYLKLAIDNCVIKKEKIQLFG